MLRKPIITDLEEVLIEEFLTIIWPDKWHFYWGQYWQNEYFDKNKPNGQNKMAEDYLYQLLAHRSNIIEENPVRSGIYSVTKKAMEIYDLGSYEEWEKFESDRVDFFRTQFKLEKDMVAATKSTSDATSIGVDASKKVGRNTLIVAGISVGITMISLIQQCRESSKLDILQQQLRIEQELSSKARVDYYIYKATHEKK